jgi:ankyrin repeat protein
MKKQYFFLMILIFAKVEYGLTQPTSFLRKYHPEVSGYQSSNRAAILFLVRNQNFDSLDSLLNLGFDINEPDVYGNTVLSEMMLTITDTSLVDSLLSRGACLDCGKYISQYVLKEGIESDYKDPLSNAVINHNTTIFASLFRKYKALGIQKALSKRELIETAVTSVNYYAFCELSNYFDFTHIDDKNIAGQTLFTQAIESVVIIYSILLLEEKNTETKDLLNRGIKIIGILLSKGADINKVNDKGETALTIAKDIPKLSKFLKKRGAK